MTSPAGDRAAGGRDDWVRVGVVSRPHGVRGGLRLHLDNRDSEVLREKLELKLGETVFCVTRSYGDHRVELEGVDDRDAAEALRAREIWVRRADFPPPDDDESYLVDLIGARVLHADDDRELGVIAAFSDNTVQPLAEVKTGDGETRLMPFVPGIVVDVDEDAGVVRVAPPEGLLDGEAFEASTGASKKT